MARFGRFWYSRLTMEMSIEEKINRVTAIIDEARTVQKINPVYIPTAYFKLENLGFPSPRDVFRVLREKGAIVKLMSWWGFDEIGKNGQTKFIKTDGDEPKNDDDFEVYEIEINEKKLHQFRNSKRTPSDEVEFDTQNGVIHFGKILHAFQKGRKGQLRLNLFRELWDMRKIKKGGKEKLKGGLLPANALALRLGFVTSSQSYSKDYEAKDKLGALLKNTERTLQRKNIPIRLYQKGGIQIVIEI